METKPEVILINPCRFIGQNEEDSFDYGQKYMPLGLLSIGTYLEVNDFRVRIIDAPMDKNFKEEIKKCINQNLLFVGISVMTANIDSALDITKYIKNLNSNTAILWGGIHPTLFPEQTCKHLLIDYVICGEGEYPVLELTKKLKNNEKLLNIKGILYKNDGKIFYNKELFSPIDINEMPIFNYDLLEVEKYVYKNVDVSGVLGGQIKRVMPVLAGLGCPYHCTFCINDIESKKKYRGKSAERLLQEVDLMVNKYRAEFIHFEDEIFLLNKDRIEKFLSGLETKGYNIQWGASTRANFYKPELLSEKLQARMKKNGCLRLGIGVESGSPRMLEVYDKRITLQMVEFAAKNNYENGFFTSYSYIIGSPGEKEEEIIQTIKFAEKIKKIDPFGTPIFHTFRPQPGCALYQKSTQLGYHPPKSLEEWGELVKSSLRGYSNLEDLPWLNKGQALFYEYLSIFAELSFQDFRRIKKNLRVPAWFAKQLFLFRLHNNFWHLMIEMHAYHFLKKHGLFKYIRKIFFSPKKIVT